MEQTKAVSQKEEKEIAEVSDDELLALMNQNAELQNKESESEGVKADYLLLAKDGTKALKKSQKDLYIEGLAMGDIFIQKSKTVLGESVKVVPLAFLTLYQEKDGTSRDANFFGVWNKEQATQFDLVDGSYYNRQLPNGHILVPVNWVCVEVIGHPELENAVVAFKSTGSRIWKSWKDDAKDRSQSSATLVYTLKEEGYKNDNFEWTDFGFDYTESLLETDKAMAVKCLKKSNAIRESYARHSFVPDHAVASVSDAPQVKMIEAEVEDSYDEEDTF